MDSDRNQPLVNNNYPNLENNNVIGQPVNYPPQQNQGWNANQPNQNQGWQNNQPNQGYQPNNQGYNQGGYAPQPNQGFNNNVQPNYGGQQPFVPGQQPMPNLNQDKIIIIKEHSSMPCRMCGFDGQSTWRQSAGCAAFAWCVCLFLCFWPLFWLPFCMDSCYDTQVVCTRCGQVKGTIPANCC